MSHTLPASRLSSVACVVFAALACICLPCAGLHAQSEPTPNVADKPKGEEARIGVKRERLLNEGLSLRRKGDDKGALVSFEEALQLGRDARVVAQIALAEEALGRWAKSYVHLREALTDSGHRWIRSNRALLEAELKKIEAEIGRLEVSVNEDGAEVTLGEEPIGQSPLQEQIVSNPGTVVLSVSKAGFVTVTTPVVVDAGGLTRAEIHLVPVAAAPVVVAPAAPPRAEPVTSVVVKKRHPAFLYAAGGGALIALISIGPWLGAGRQTDGIVKDCNDGNGCADKTWQSSRDRVQSLDRAANGLLYSGLAVAVLATGAYFLFPVKERQADVQPSAWVAPSGFGLSASGQFGGLR
jgi:hypothetical protein